MIYAPPNTKREGLIFRAVSTLCQFKHITSSAQPKKWPSTREIAEYCELNIYQTRYVLLNLVKKGLVEVSPRSINNSLRWRISATQNFILIAPKGPPREG